MTIAFWGAMCSMYTFTDVYIVQLWMADLPGTLCDRSTSGALAGVDVGRFINASGLITVLTERSMTRAGGHPRTLSSSSHCGRSAVKSHSDMMPYKAT